MRRKKYLFSSAFLIGCLLFGQQVKADDPMLATAQECTRHLPTMERLYNIPAHWLAAIASTESGRYHPRLRLSVPWPWTINVNGSGHWFNTKQEAIRAVQSYQARGIKSIDVGCMQVNLLYHGQAFANLSQAFEPIYNIAYAAKFLRQHYNNTSSWTKATAAYHSMQSRRGADYYRKVYKKWQEVVDRLNEAVFSAPMQQALQSELPAPRNSFAFREPDAPLSAAKNPAQPTNSFRVAAPSMASGLQQQAPVRMNSIKVTRGNIMPAPQAMPPYQPQPQMQVSNNVSQPQFQPRQQFRPQFGGGGEPSMALAANNPAQEDIMQAAMPPQEALTPLDLLENGKVTSAAQDSPPSRQYEKGVLVIRANQSQTLPSTAREEGRGQARLATDPQPDIGGKGQFAPHGTTNDAPDATGGYVTERAKPRVAGPKFVF